MDNITLLYNFSDYNISVMIKELKHYNLPESIDDGNRSITNRDLYLVEAGESEIERGTQWDSGGRKESNLLVYCTKGEGTVYLEGEQVPVSGDQFFIVRRGDIFSFFPDPKTDCRFLYAGFRGRKVKHMVREFSVVRNLVPSVNNMVANREMLFYEIFNNLSKGFHDQNIEYVNLCFGHLLATFIFASRTSDDIADEINPVMRRALSFLEKNLRKKLTLNQISREVGYSPTYFTTLFRKETNYPPMSYFAHLKILKACEFLDYTKMKIKEISFRLGYSDPYYFTRDFKKKMGMPPRQYRNRIKE
ncbi:MAG: AraC family transcriptional regulator [Bacteroidales bacterium]|jgi:AraC-like DNA-binding protein/mannose-6-phosphate isomerase-like protein (cupin superfamily)|nr:AraC family transcriptional regulator [Bacteroidales bacterium]